MKSNNSNDKISLIAAIITLLLAAPTFVGLIVGLIEKNNEAIISTGIIGAILIIILLISIIHALVKKHNSRLYRWFKYKTAHKGYILLLKREVYYEFKDREHIIHKKTFEVLGRSEFNTFEDRYVYSGSAQCKVNPSLPGQTITGEYRYLGWNFYTIQDKTKTKKGGKNTFGMQMDEIDDSDHKSLLYLSTGIYEQTKLLSMEVRFGSSLTPKNCKLNIYSDYTSQTPFRTEFLTFDSENHCLKYELKYPVYHYKYEITWEF